MIRFSFKTLYRRALLLVLAVLCSATPLVTASPVSVSISRQAFSVSRLTKSVGIGAAVVGGCLLYRFLQTRNLLLLKEKALFITKLPNGNLVIGENDSNISVWDSQNRTCLKRIKIAETIPGVYLQIVALSNDEIALLCRITGKVARVHLNAQEKKAAYQEIKQPVGRDLQEKEVIFWIAKTEEGQLICKTNKGHFYQLDKHGSQENVWNQLPDDNTPAEMPADALGKCDYSQVQLSDKGKIARVVNNDWLYNGSVAIEECVDDSICREKLA